MNILFVSPYVLTKKHGAAKVLLELGEALGKLGWQCQFVEARDPANPGTPSTDRSAKCEWFRNHIKKWAPAFDVVEYDHDYLPFPRTDFDPETLMVARAQLLCHNLTLIKIPVRAGLRSWLGSYWYYRSRQATLQQRFDNATVTLQESDLVTLSNESDRRTVNRIGIPAEKVVVFPNALNDDRRLAFAAMPRSLPANPRIAFVGTFDPRKGSREFPRIVQDIVRHHPTARFRLVGTAGMYPSEASVRAEFPRHLRDSLEIVPEFEPETLPGMLSECTVGMYPSYLEGFPSGVLEMLAASLPVVAYDAPGLSMMLPERLLVRPGDGIGMAAKLLGLLGNPARLQEERAWARTRSSEFKWSEVAARVSAEYVRRIEMQGARRPDRRPERIPLVSAPPS